MARASSAGRPANGRPTPARTGRRDRLLDIKVVVSPGAAALVNERGGELYVWSRTSRCCGGATSVLEASTDRVGRQAFTRVSADAISLYVALPRLPATLEIDVVGRLRPTVRAFFDGLAWVA